jgi:hypothetical protein
VTVTVDQSLRAAGICLGRYRKELTMPQYELVLEGLLSDESIADLPGFVATRQDATTVLQGELSSQDLLRVLETFAALGLGLQRLSRVEPSAE